MATAPSTPNILFIFSDQQRWDTMGCYGQRRLITPHLDAIAREGVRFERTFTAQPVCGPCRASLQSGLYPTAIGCHVNNRSLPVDQPTLAKSLDAAGYETAYVGKWHLASDEELNVRMRAVPPERRGGYRTYWMAADALEHTSSGYEGYFFDGDNKRVDWEGYRVDRTTDFALDFLDQHAERKSGKPFFMFLSYLDPHHQNDLDRYIGPIGSKQKFADYDVPGDLQGTEGDWRQHYPDYLGACHSIDANVGRLRDRLQALGLWENTLLIYTSDHGCHFRTRNYEYKRSCHDSSTRVPLIMHGPGFTGGKVVPQMVSLLDLPPTMLEVACAKPLPRMDGASLLPLVADEGGVASIPGQGWRDAMYVQISEADCGRAIRTDRWIYSVTDASVPVGVASRDKKSKLPAAEIYREDCLYDLEADPHQRDNRVSDPALKAVREQLATTLLRECEKFESARPQIVPA